MGAADRNYVPQQKPHTIASAAYAHWCTHDAPKESTTSLGSVALDALWLLGTVSGFRIGPLEFIIY